MTPDRYTSIEGGDWKPWTAGDVSDTDLEQRDDAAVTINRVTVHSLVTHSGLRWDCVHGRGTLRLNFDHDVI